ncbi:hypothetical protein DID88_008534 [Monilinia fructigena]|uniref:SET domain-containing protein n=1 Tax=Monilinia fructigena TaxID=38457 RepID=A0A395J5P3_9HELO|nr:hypothetical protein DID88_008534 [Monilinia fructigena]
MDHSNDTNAHLLQEADSSSSNGTGIDMQIHHEFTQWAVSQGVIINGIAPFRFPGKGLGLVANRDFEIGDTLVQVPIKTLRKATDVSSQYSELAPNITVHSLLALSLDLLSTAEPSTTSHQPSNPPNTSPQKEDRLALNPFADYMNHSAQPTVNATLSRAGYTLTASQPIKQGSEVHISYGSHKQ